MFERFTDEARRVVVWAQEESRSRDHVDIDVTHLALAGLKVCQPGLRVDVPKVRDAIVAGLHSRTVQRGRTDHIPLTPACKEAMDEALRRALRDRRNYVDQYDLLFAALEHPTIAQPLVASGLDVQLIRAAVAATQHTHVSRAHDPGHRSSTTGDQADRVATFRNLHASGCFVMPNPWDVGTARALAHLGFPALATTSAGFAWTLGREDTEVTRDETLEHLRLVSEAVAVPVNADFRDGHAVDPVDVAANVTLAVATGVAGLSIEDATSDPADPLYEFELAVERIRAAREAIDDGGTGVVLTGRSEGFVWDRPDLDETIRRLRAYADAGADCLYAPRIDRADQVAAIVEAVAPKPVNVLINAPFLTVADAAALGVRRISVGGTLARAAWRGFVEAARDIADQGSFARFQDLPNVDALLEDPPEAQDPPEARGGAAPPSV